MAATQTYMYKQEKKKLNTECTASQTVNGQPERGSIIQIADHTACSTID